MNKISPDEDNPFDVWLTVGSKDQLPLVSKSIGEAGVIAICLEFYVVSEEPPFIIISDKFVVALY